MPYSAVTDSSRRWKYLACPDAQVAAAPQAPVWPGSGTPSSASTWTTVPGPSDALQAPYRELNEKLRGASSSTDLPAEGRARFSEKVSSSGSASAGASAASSP